MYFWQRKKKMKAAIYPGSFDPVTYGHLDIIRRAASVFDELTVSVLVDYAASKDVTVVVRGLRAITDFEYELQNAQTNRKLSGDKLDTMFLTTSLEYAYLSSSSVKEIASFNGDISQCVPPFVARLVYEKFGHAREN